MGTPGLSLIQDLLAKSVAKWSGEAVKSTEHEKKNIIKIETNNIKVEYIETETIPHNVKLEADTIKDERCKIKGLKRKLVETKTEKDGKKKKISHNTSKYGVLQQIKQTSYQKEINVKTEPKVGHDVAGIKIDTQIKQSRESKLQVKATGRHEISSKVHKKTNFKRKFFSPEEDEILQHAIDTDDINCKDLAEQLGRTGGSIDTRIRRLKCGGRKFARRDYSLVEDLLIMDRMLKRLPGKRLEDLEMLVDSTTPEFLTSLGRTMISGPMYRWGVQLKPWILQHYAGTLNLDIKRMLANYIADTFDSFDSIDWALVVQRPDFAGHTMSSLKHMFYGNLFNSTKKHLKLEPSEVTLKNIADDTGLRQKVCERVLIRQKQVIDYFEQYVEKHGITNFL